MSRLLAIVVLGMLCQVAVAQEAKPVARLITSLTPVTAHSAPSAVVEPNDIEKRAFEQTNLMRIKNGLPPFVWDSDVCRMRVADQQWILPKQVNSWQEQFAGAGNQDVCVLQPAPVMKRIIYVNEL